jgi:hypothetical protein
MGFVGICALYLFWKTTPESQYEKFTDFVVGNQVDSLAKSRSTRLVPNLDSIIDPSQLESIPDSVRHDSVKTLIRQKEIQP